MAEKPTFFEVHPMRGHSRGDWYAAQKDIVDSDENAEYWALFSVTSRGNRHCLGEFPTKAEALAAKQYARQRNVDDWAAGCGRKLRVKFPDFRLFERPLYAPKQSLGIIVLKAADDPKRTLGISQQMRKITYPWLMILAVVANSATADDADDAHYVSHGPLRSDQYYWVRSDNVDFEYDSELQDQAIDDLVFCRGLQEEEFGDRRVMKPTAEHNVRICMIKCGWGIRQFTVRQ